MLLPWLIILTIFGIFVYSAGVAAAEKSSHQAPQRISDGGGPAIRPRRRHSVAKSPSANFAAAPETQERMPQALREGIPFQGGDPDEIRRLCAQSESDNGLVEADSDGSTVGPVELHPLSAYDDLDGYNETVEIGSSGVFVPVDEPEISLSDDDEALLRELLMADMKDD